MKFAFIQAEKATFPVTVLCRVLGVSRAGFYGAQRRPRSPRGIEEARLEVQIAAIHRASRRRYGSPRVHAELRARGQCTSRKRVARLMRRAGLVARRRRAFRITTLSRHTDPVAPNRLARQFAHFNDGIGILVHKRGKSVRNLHGHRNNIGPFDGKDRVADPHLSDLCPVNR